jgi:HD-GYP domain-containing protein (c-di-GMP phosphodiesterase class II)
MGVHLGFSNSLVESLAIAALNHDIGKMRIPLEILNKTDNLTPEELQIIMKHPALGVEYYARTGKLDPIIEKGILQHHECYDGSGYPEGLKHDRISQVSRIIALADVFDAITSKHIYKEAYLPSEAMEYIMANSGIHFDPELVKLFIRKVAPYPVGMSVRLSNGLVGIVAETFENFTMRPRVKIIPNMHSPNLAPTDSSPDKPYFLNLKNPENADITIIGVVE